MPTLTHPRSVSKMLITSASLSPKRVPVPHHSSDHGWIGGSNRPKRSHGFALRTRQLVRLFAHIDTTTLAEGDGKDVGNLSLMSHDSPFCRPPITRAQPLYALCITSVCGGNDIPRVWNRGTRLLLSFVHIVECHPNNSQHPNNPRRLRPASNQTTPRADTGHTTPEPRCYCLPLSWFAVAVGMSAVITVVVIIVVFLSILTPASRFRRDETMSNTPYGDAAKSRIHV